MPVLSKRIVLDCFYLLIFYFEKFSINVCRLPCAVNVNLNLSNVLLLYPLINNLEVSFHFHSTFLQLNVIKIFTVQ